MPGAVTDTGSLETNTMFQKLKKGHASRAQRMRGLLVGGEAGPDHMKP